MIIDKNAATKDFEDYIQNENNERNRREEDYFNKNNPSTYKLDLNNNRIIFYFGKGCKGADKETKQYFIYNESFNNSAYRYSMDGKRHRDDGPAICPLDPNNIYDSFILDNEYWDVLMYLKLVNSYIKDDYSKQLSICSYINNHFNNDRSYVVDCVRMALDPDIEIPNLIRKFLLKDKFINLVRVENNKNQDELKKLIENYKINYKLFTDANNELEDFKAKNDIKTYDINNVRIPIKLNDNLKLSSDKLHGSYVLIDNFFKEKLYDLYNSGAVHFTKYKSCSKFIDGYFSSNAFDFIKDYKNILNNVPIISIDYYTIVINKIKDNFDKKKALIVMEDIKENCFVNYGHYLYNNDKRWLEVINEYFTNRTSDSKDLLLDLHSISFKGKNLDDKCFNVLKHLV